MTDTEQRLQRRQDIYSTDMPDGGTALLDTGNSAYHGANSAGRRIWELLEHPRSLNELVGILTSEFTVDEHACRRDCAAFLSQLDAQKLLGGPGS